MFHGEFLRLDIVLAAAMGLLMVLSAIYDAHGAEVPDTVTVPYAMFGICTSVLHGRVAAGLIALLLLVIVLTGWTPRWLSRANKRLMDKSYGEETGLQKETDLLSMKAASFEQRHGRWIDVLVNVIIVTGVMAIFVCIPYDGLTLQEIFLFFALFALLGPYAVLKQKAKRAGGSGEMPVEELSAFGGADTIVIAGILGFYGGIPFVYGMAATMAVVFLFALVGRLRGKRGIAMLPGILVTAPIRLYILIVYCPRLIQAFNWAMENMLPNLFS